MKCRVFYNEHDLDDVDLEKRKISPNLKKYKSSTAARNSDDMRNLSRAPGKTVGLTDEIAKLVELTDRTTIQPADACEKSAEGSEDIQDWLDDILNEC